jgi:hypothetical protein
MNINIDPTNLPAALLRSIAWRIAMGRGAVERVAAATGYSVQHASRILSGHRPQPLVMAWAAGAAGAAIGEAWPDGPKVPTPVRVAWHAGRRGEVIEARALWEVWKLEHPARRPVWRSVVRPAAQVAASRAQTPSPTRRGGI